MNEINSRSFSFASLLPWILVPLRQRHQSKAYRPDIDGLRAVAVLAVILNHFNPDILSGGFLGVDIFFVISGYVVTASLLASSEAIGRSRRIWPVISSFYQRRLKRLQPALIAMVLMTSGLFALLVAPNEDDYISSLRTGISSLFGVSNIYLLRQSNDYFGAANIYEPFLHTWSLAVEEQFYLIWPFIVCISGLVRLGDDRYRLKLLARIAGVLAILSLSYYLFLYYSGQEARAFFLMPSRLWELAIGCLAYIRYGYGDLKHANHQKNTFYSDNGTAIRPGSVGRSRRHLLICALTVIVLATLFSPEDWRQWTTMLMVFTIAALLASIKPDDHLGRLLATPWLVAIGLLSYSLYLWHWPLLVLARWTIGVRMHLLLPLALVIVLVSLISYRLEQYFRYAPVGSGLTLLRRSWLLFPLVSLMVAGWIYGLQGALKGRLYTGTAVASKDQIGNSRWIEGTTIHSAGCFLDPTSPPLASDQARSCRARSSDLLPTIYFEGDSHAHALMPVAAGLFNTHRYDVSVIARGGCPSPYFEPWINDAFQSSRYRGCQPHYELRRADLLSSLRPGDRLVLSANLFNYIGKSEDFRSSPRKQRIADSYQKALLDLAAAVQDKGARLVIILPLPSFPQPKFSFPLSLCHREWFRPPGSLSVDCREVLVRRDLILQQTSHVRGLLLQAAAGASNIDVFDPLPILCPPADEFCSNHYKSRLLFTDGSHLSSFGADRLTMAFTRFLDRSRSSASGPDPVSR